MGMLDQEGRQQLEIHVLYVELAFTKVQINEAVLQLVEMVLEQEQRNEMIKTQ